MEGAVAGNITPASSVGNVSTNVDDNLSATESLNLAAAESEQESVGVSSGLPLFLHLTFSSTLPYIHCPLLLSSLLPSSPHIFRNHKIVGLCHQVQCVSVYVSHSHHQDPSLTSQGQRLQDRILNSPDHEFQQCNQVP